MATKTKPKPKFKKPGMKRRPMHSANPDYGRAGIMHAEAEAKRELAILRVGYGAGFKDGRGEDGWTEEEIELIYYNRHDSGGFTHPDSLKVFKVEPH
jgi:hypothetical protein